MLGHPWRWDMRFMRSAKSRRSPQKARGPTLHAGLLDIHLHRRAVPDSYE